MSFQLMVIAWLAAAAQGFAPAPIRWAPGSQLDQRFVVALKTRVNKAFPIPLSIMDHPGRRSYSEIPYFTAKPDNTISWAAELLCVEAAGNEVGEAILVNHCTGEQNQKWELAPWRGGQRTEIQLKGTQNCINVDDREGILNGAPIALAKCDGKVTEAWEVARQLPVAAQHFTPPSFLRHVAISAMLLSVLGVLGLRARLWRRGVLLVKPIGQDDIALNVDQSGVSLTIASPVQRDSMAFSASSDHVSVQDSVPAVMALGTEMAAAQDYRPTIFLPQTDFPMKGDLPQREPELLKRWEAMGLYELMQNKAEGRDKFIIHDGPPFANGHLHLGHALNKILKDVINKTQYKLGKATPYIPGWDCHGLPIEAKIEERYRKKGIKKDEIPRVQFRQDCQNFAQEWIDIQREEFKRLGVLADWEHPYTTMDSAAEAEIVRNFGVFLMNGSLYRGIKPVMWSVVEKTALAEMEVEYFDIKSPSIFVRFPLYKTSLAVLEGASAIIWTTTPWTLPGNRAIAYGNDFSYIALRIDETADTSIAKVGEVVLIAEGLKESFEKEVGITSSTILSQFKGSQLKETCARHPFNGEGYDFDVPLLPGDHVTLEIGTGLVHTAPGHGVEDFIVGKEFELEVPETVADDGLLQEHVPLFAGQHVYKVAPAIIAKLEERSALLKHGEITNSYPHSWRSKTPLIYRTTPQWFISLEKKELRAEALKAIQTVQWMPETGKNRIQSMIENRPDWCVSRQRTWGVPLPIFVNKETEEVLRDHKVVDRIVNAVKEEGSAVWYTADPARFLGPDYDPANYEQTLDTIDVWFDSASSQSFVLRLRSEMEWPADLYLEGSDQHRGWFQSSLMVGCGTAHAAPYKQVLTHGFVVDEEGRKMSKSRGEVISPKTITDTLGADILRLWVISSNYYEDLRVGPEILKRQQDIYRRYRNTFRYLLGALAEFSPTEELGYAQMPELEKWVLHRLHEIDQKVREACRSYEFQALYAEIYNFCAVDLSSFYFAIRKDSLYCDDPQNVKRRATRTVMDVTFDCLAKWLSPVLYFTTEEAWLSRYPSETGSVHLEIFPNLPCNWNTPGLSEKYEKLRLIRKVTMGALEVARASKQIRSSLQADLKIFFSPSLLPSVQDIDLAEFSIVSSVEVLAADLLPEDGFTLEDVPGISVIVSPASGEKCERCWKILPEVGQIKTNPDLCYRCAEVVQKVS